VNLRVEDIEITNVKGIAHAILKPRTLTVIKGGNGTGKTSLLSAINAIFEGGHDPTLIRAGEERAQVVMTLSDGVVIDKVTTLKDSYLTIKTADGLEVKRPKAYVESLASSFAFDPIAFMTAAPKDRLKYLLEAMPVEFTVPELATALPDDGTFRELLPKSALDLSQFGVWLEGIRERRKVAKLELEQVKKTCESLKKTLPKEAEQADWTEVIAALERKREKVRTAEEQAVDAIAIEAKAERDKQGAELLVREETLRAEFARALQAIQDERLTISRTIGEAESSAIADARQGCAADRERIAGEIATAQENAQRAAGDNALRAHYDAQRAQLRDKDNFHLWLDGFVERLDVIKKQNLDTLPIPGLEVRNGQIFYDGLDYDKQTNTGQQFKIAVQISALRFGALPFMIADKGEHLDSASWQEIAEAVEGTDIQILMTCVDPDSGPLRTEPSGALAA
jgi:hypothetical protein